MYRLFFSYKLYIHTRFFPQILTSKELRKLVLLYFSQGNGDGLTFWVNLKNQLTYILTSRKWFGSAAMVSVYISEMNIEGMGML